MKLILGLLMVSNAFAFEIIDKNPERVDISISSLVDHYCSYSGYFNPAVCVDAVNKCYNKTHWPKTVDVRYKIDIMNGCFDKVKSR